jgi:hypothetical protein
MQRTKPYHLLTFSTVWLVFFISSLARLLVSSLKLLEFIFKGSATILSVQYELVGKGRLVHQHPADIQLGARALR